jgi:sialate O-acetylesterase
MAVIIDIGAENDIHPKNKQDVGKRLAHLALANDYGRKDVIPSGPLYRSHTIDGDTIRIQFDHVGTGLMVADKGGNHYLDPVQETADARLNEFSIQDNSGNWHWAKAVIDGDQIIVSNEAVKEPQNVRFGYDSNPRVNLYNREGLPASPFTTTD